MGLMLLYILQFYTKWYSYEDNHYGSWYAIYEWKGSSKEDKEPWETNEVETCAHHYDKWELYRVWNQWMSQS